jgi:hypothetical protein
MINGCNSERKNWEKAKVENTIDSYYFFMLENPFSNYGKAAEAEINRLFKELIPEKPSCTLNSNLSVCITPPQIYAAEYYLIYYSHDLNALISKISTPDTISYSKTFWPDGFPIYYRIVAVRGSVKSKPSQHCEVAPLSSHYGSRCQICGVDAIGYCSNRNIYVCSFHNKYTSREGTNWRCP